MTHVEVYLDRAVYRDPLQHGDVVGGCKGVAEHVNILLFYIYFTISVKMR